MKRLLDGYYRLLQIVMTILMGLMIVPVALQIVSRYSESVPRYIWTEEIARFCFVWIIMLGSMIAVRDGAHFDVDLLPLPETPRQKAVGRFIVHLGMTILALMFTWYGYDFARSGAVQTSPVTGINMLSIYAAFPLAGITWILFLAEKISVDVRGIAGRQRGS